MAERTSAIWFSIIARSATDVVERSVCSRRSISCCAWRSLLSRSAQRATNEANNRTISRAAARNVCHKNVPNLPSADDFSKDREFFEEGAETFSKLEFSTRRGIALQHEDHTRCSLDLRYSFICRPCCFCGGKTNQRADYHRRLLPDRKSTRLNSSHGYISY